MFGLMVQFCLLCYRILVVCLVCVFDVFFFFKQKTAYDMRIRDWSSDVCSSDLGLRRLARLIRHSGGYSMSMSLTTLLRPLLNTSSPSCTSSTRSFLTIGNMLSTMPVSRLPMYSPRCCL